MEPNGILIFGIFLVALMYSSVGHGGASGYIALLTLAGFAIHDIRSFVLLLNIGVSFTALVQFTRSGFLKFRFTLPFILTGIPCAYLGASFHLEAKTLSLFLGIVLIFSAFRLFWKPQSSENIREPQVLICLLWGAALGLLAGITGTGGGIFLTPLLILASWATPKHAAASSALFILVNSLAGIAASMTQKNFQFLSLELLLAAYLGGLIGSTLGSRFLTSRIIQITLAIVLCIAAIKLLKI